MPKRILVIDDSATAQLLHGTLLRRHGYEVLSARSGEEGVRVATREQPSLVLMDLVMPGMDGLQALSELRSRPATRSIPVIMVTTRGEGRNVESGYANGCSDYITKPVDGLELLAKVRSCVGAA